MSRDYYSALSPYLKTQKYCGGNASDPNDCLATSYSNLSQTSALGSWFADTATGVQFQLINGSVIKFYVLSNNCSSDALNLCANVYIDINGTRGPNQVGIDFFLFQLRKNSIEPYGTPRDIGKTMSDYCSKSSTESNNGDVCAGWIIYKENMDYLHCDGLSWDGKNKCS